MQLKLANPSMHRTDLRLVLSHGLRPVEVIWHIMIGPPRMIASCPLRGRINGHYGLLDLRRQRLSLKLLIGSIFAVLLMFHFHMELMFIMELVISLCS